MNQEIGDLRPDLEPSREKNERGFHYWPKTWFFIFEADTQMKARKKLDVLNGGFLLDKAGKKWKFYRKNDKWKSAGRKGVTAICVENEWRKRVQTSDAFWRSALVPVSKSSFKWYSFMFLVLFCLNSAFIRNATRKWQTDGRLDGRTSHRDARTYLRKEIDRKNERKGDKWKDERKGPRSQS